MRRRRVPFNGCSTKVVAQRDKRFASFLTELKVPYGEQFHDSTAYLKHFEKLDKDLESAAHTVHSSAVANESPSPLTSAVARSQEATQIASSLNSIAPDTRRSGGSKQPVRDSASATAWSTVARNPNKPSFSKERGSAKQQTKMPVATKERDEAEAQSKCNPAVGPSTNLPLSKYNPDQFETRPKVANFFVIKSYCQDDVYKSIKYGVWASTNNGNRRLDTAFRAMKGRGPIYLFFSVNGSGRFSGMAEMMTPVDYDAVCEHWQQDKWKGMFEVKWIFVKDIPNQALRYIRLENNENKPVTNSRDTQEILYKPGLEMLKVFHRFRAKGTILDDVTAFEKPVSTSSKKASSSAGKGSGQQQRRE